MMDAIVSKTLRLPAAVDAALKATAEREGRSENAVAVDAIARYASDRARRRADYLAEIVREDRAILDALA